MSKRTRISGLIDIVKITEPELITELASLPALDRAFEPIGPWFNRVIVTRLLRNFGFPKGLAPTMLGRADPIRQQIQTDLYTRLSRADIADQDWHKAGITALASYVRGTLDHDGMGEELQQMIGLLFKADYKASADTWLASQEFDGAARASSPLAWLSEAITGTGNKAKAVLSNAVDGDPAGIHATGIALHNLVSSLKALRRAYIDPDKRKTLDAPRALALSLVAPTAVLRQVKEPFTLRPFGQLERGTLVILALDEALGASGDRRIAFMLGGWSACPAEAFAGDLMTRVWKEAVSGGDL